MKKLLLLLALGVCTFKAQAQLIAEWNFNGSTVASTFTDPLFVSSASNLVAFGGVNGPLGYPPGCPGPIPDRGSVWDGMNTPLNLSRYIEVEIVSSQDIVLTMFNIKTRRASNGAVNWQLRWSVDGYSSSIYATDTGSTSCVSHSMGLPANLVLSGGSVGFRIYAYGASSPTGGFVIDDVEIHSVTSTLPISLLSFTGEVVGSKSFLKWQTATEEENSHFTIERSQDARGWETLGTVPGAGDSYVVREYSFVDEAPPTGTTYYRLLQTDFDGTVRNYQTIAVWREESVTSIYPNPARKGETLRIEGGSYSLVEILDGSGKLAVKKYAYEALVLDLASGMYLARVTDLEGRTSIQRLILTE